MRPCLVRPSKRRKMEAPGMSDYVEIIYPQSMTAKLMHNGEVIAEYKVAQCDGCALVVKIDAFGYKIGQGGEKLAWLCGGCR
jgi:hypothetical protein